MNTYNYIHSTPQPKFCSKFNTEIYQTKRSLNCLKRTIAEKNGLKDYFDSFMSRITNNNKDDILELSQYEKYYLITNTSTNQEYKIPNKNIIEKLENFILLHNKKAPK